MNKWFWSIVILVLICGIGLLFFLWSDENRPEGISGPPAEKMAQQIYKAVNKEAWDSLAFVGWSFRDNHHYLWNKQENVVEVRWSDYQVLLDPEELSGQAYINNEKAKGTKKTELIQSAFEYYCNDGFWFHAFTKLHDPGTTRELIKEDGEKALLVTYNKGGVTPGDAYLWYTDSTGLPKGFKIWASIIPVDGLYYTWENWDTLYNGALVAREHNMDVNSVEINNIISGPTLSSVGRDPQLFSALLEEQ